jgi:hypothetical protein
MSLMDLSEQARLNPLDVVEGVAAVNGWSFERATEDEITIVVAGHWTDYQVSYTWMGDIEALHLACAFDLKVPELRRAEVQQLIALINEQMWIGHFDMWSGEGVVIFRNSHLLTGGAEVSPQQCEALLRSATDACDLYYQAFQFVVWAGKSAADALSEVMFETVGEA